MTHSNHYRSIAMVLCLGSLTASLIQTAAADSQPNIVLLMPDDVG